MGFVNKPFVRILVLIIVLPSFAYSVNKCCDENQHFDEDMTCVEYPTVNETHHEESTRLYDGFENHVFTNLSSLPCDIHKSQLKSLDSYRLMENGSLLFIEKSVVFSENTYCLEMYDRNGLGLVRAVYSCPCTDHLCVWKCCVPGMALAASNETANDESTTLACISKISKPWNVDQLNATDLPSYHVEKYKYYKSCEKNKVNTFLLKIKSHHEYSLQRNGSIATDHYGLIGKDEYCGDFELMDNSSQPILLACVREPEVKDKYIYYAVLNTIGSLFLLVTMSLHVWLPELAGLHGKCLICHACCLLVAHICNTINQIAIKYPSPNVRCCFLAYLMQFSYLTSFFWLNVICVDMALTFGRIRPTKADEQARKCKKRFTLYSFYSWGGGVFMTCFTLLMEYIVRLPEGSFSWKPNIGTSRCWFFENKAVVLYFYGPMSALLVANLGLFIFTVRRIVMMSRGNQVLQQAGNVRHDATSNSGLENKRFVIYLKIFSLMGICWLMEIISWLAAGPDEIWYFTDGINSLRGFFIFIVFCWKSKVYKGIHNKLPWLRLMYEFRLRKKKHCNRSNGIEIGGTISDQSTRTSVSAESRKTDEEEL